MLALKDTDACFCLRMLTCRSMFVLCSFVSLFMYVFTFVPVRRKRAVEGKQLCVCLCTCEQLLFERAPWGESS